MHHRLTASRMDCTLSTGGLGVARRHFDALLRVEADHWMNDRLKVGSGGIRQDRS
jgi:hypothetical protein